MRYILIYSTVNENHQIFLCSQSRRTAGTEKKNYVEKANGMHHVPTILV